MADNSKIEWTDATQIIDRGGRRVRLYMRADPSRPGQQERRRRAALGEAWCRRCTRWSHSDGIKQGLCAEHRRLDAKERYAADLAYRDRRKAHSQRRKRGVEMVPIDGGNALLEYFDNRCAYCPALAETFDHVIAVSSGGMTCAGNILPACIVCNSSKRDRDVVSWIDTTGRQPHVITWERLQEMGVI